MGAAGDDGVKEQMRAGIPILRCSAIGAVAGLLILSIAAPADSRPGAAELIRELGCGVCHTGLAEGSTVSAKAPSLGYAGLRYSPAYLFHYLQNPEPVRPDIGPSRMPDFHLSRRESLALTLFLAQQRTVPDEAMTFPGELDDRAIGSPAVLTQGKAAVDESRCLACHRLSTEGRDTGTDLATVGFRLDAGWARRFLADPQHYHPGISMPALFYARNDSGTLNELVPDAGEKIQSIVHYLFSLASEHERELQRTFDKALAEHPEVDAETGRRIFVAQNCAACHGHSTIGATKNAPDLSAEGSRVREDWLTGYLKRPKPVRPFGYYPGTGSRMPDFRLTDEEVVALTDYLMMQYDPADTRVVPSPPLSAFSMNKAHRLIKEKLSCLGCHQLGNDGGRIGPNLSRVKDRLSPNAVRLLTKHPRSSIPDTVMPTPALPERTLDLIANYLLRLDIPTEDTTYLSLIDNPPYFYSDQTGGERLYNQYCASCHGVQGDGRGFNATYLPRPPTKHSDRAYLSGRPDDTLFDGIYAGGHILGKSPRMPGWGHTLSRDEITSLVRYIRLLCQCRGPAWSLDN